MLDLVVFGARPTSTANCNRYTSSALFQWASIISRQRPEVVRALINWARIRGDSRCAAFPKSNFRPKISQLTVSKEAALAFAKCLSRNRRRRSAVNVAVPAAAIGMLSIMRGRRRDVFANDLGCYLKDMLMSSRNTVSLSDKRSSAHRIWALGTTGMELQRGRNVKTYKLPAHFHDDYQFMLVDTGAREINFRRERRVFGGEYLTVVNPGEAHSTGCFGEHGSSFRTMHFPVALWAESGGGTGTSSNQPLFPFEVENGYVLKVFARLHGLIECEGITLRSEELLSEFIDAMVSSCKIQPRRREKTKGVGRNVYLVRDYIQDNYAKTLTLDELAALAGLSKYHLLRSFSEIIGMPPHAFQIRVRLNRAKRLLSRGVPIKQVAAATGFADPSHFGKHFARLIGFTPKTYQSAVDDRLQIDR